VYNVLALCINCNRPKKFRSRDRPVTRAPVNTKPVKKVSVEQPRRRRPAKHINYNGPRGKDSILSTVGSPFRWKKGQSGNPGGRPKHLVADALRDVLAERDEAAGTTNADAIARNLVHLAKGTDAKDADAIRATEFVTERTEGKVKQSMELSGPGGKEITFHVVFNDAAPAKS
jgi:hypothetical protein